MGFFVFLSSVAEVTRYLILIGNLYVIHFDEWCIETPESKPLPPRCVTP